MDLKTQIVARLSKPIRTEEDHADAMRIVDAGLDAGLEPDSGEGQLFTALLDAVERYEEATSPIPPSDPIAHIEHRLDAMGLTSKDLERMIGGRISVWRILNRRRALTLDMIRALEKHLGCDPAVLVQPYELEKEAG